TEPGYRPRSTNARAAKRCALFKQGCDLSDERALFLVRSPTAVAPSRSDAEQSELSRAQEALRASEMQLRLITENVPAMIVYFDVGFVCRFANTSYAQFFGFTRVTILGKHLS